MIIKRTQKHSQNIIWWGADKAP